MINLKRKTVINSLTALVGSDNITSKTAEYGILPSGKLWIKNFLEVLPGDIESVTRKKYSAEVTSQISIDCAKLKTVVEAADPDLLKDGDPFRICFRIVPDGFVAAPYDAPLESTWRDKAVLEFKYSSTAATLCTNIKSVFEGVLAQFEDERLPKLSAESTSTVVKLDVPSGLMVGAILVEKVEKDWQEYSKPIFVTETPDGTLSSTVPVVFTSHKNEFGGDDSVAAVVFPNGQNYAWGADHMDAKPIPGIKYDQINITVKTHDKGYGYDQIGEDKDGRVYFEIWCNTANAGTLMTFLTTNASMSAESIPGFESDSTVQKYVAGGGSSSSSPAASPAASTPASSH